MNLAQALRLLPHPTIADSSSQLHEQGGGWQAVAFAGAGGKTTALFQLARDLPPPVITSATTHLHVDQVRLADSHFQISSPAQLPPLENNLSGVTLFTGRLEQDRTAGLDSIALARLGEACASRNLPLLIEADGSRQRLLKAPGDREPVIPTFVGQVVVVAGLAGLGKPLTGEFVHRPEIFSRLSGLKPGENITLDALARLLAHPAGGQKNIPLSARRILLLNQADSPDLQALGMELASRLLPAFHSVIIASLNASRIHAVCESVAGIILAAGGSSRYGQPKQLLRWHGKPFVRVVAEAALSAGLTRLVVVTGSHAEQVERALDGLPLLLVRNRDWRSGQSSSIQAGLRSLYQPPMPGGSLETPTIQARREEMGAALFLLADQPRITPGIMRSLVEHHARTLAPIIAPLVAGQRANPVLFDRTTFPDLMALSGDVGGREIFKQIQVEPLPWDDASLLADVDTPEDYRDLVDGQ